MVWHGVVWCGCNEKGSVDNDGWLRLSRAWVD